MFDVFLKKNEPATFLCTYVHTQYVSDVWTMFNFFFFFSFLFRSKMQCWCTINRRTVTEVTFLFFHLCFCIFHYCFIFPLSLFCLSSSSFVCVSIFRTVSFVKYFPIVLYLDVFYHFQFYRAKSLLKILIKKVLHDIVLFYFPLQPTLWSNTTKLKFNLDFWSEKENVNFFRKPRLLHFIKEFCYLLIYNWWKFSNKLFLTWNYFDTNKLMRN